jgi:hypothetical protein
MRTGFASCVRGKYLVGRVTSSLQRMFGSLRALLNTIRFNFPYTFEDGSRISYHAQFDILRYESPGPVPRILDIELNYDSRTGLLRIDTGEVWRWRDPLVPLHAANESGPVGNETISFRRLMFSSRNILEVRT